MSASAPEDVPSPIDFRDLDDARAWEASADARPGRAEVLDRLATEAAARTQPGDVVLELGSGPGFLARRLLERAPGIRYVGLDFSAAMHDLARARLQPWTAQITLIERNFKDETWTQGLGPFGAVVTNQAVHELRHKRHAIGLHRQVLRVLAPGGSYFVSDHFSDPGGLGNAELYLTQDEHISVLQDAGFASVERLAVAGSLVLHVATRAGEGGSR